MSWLPDGRGLVALASEPGDGKQRGYTVDLAGGAWSPFTPEGVGAKLRIPVSPAGDVAAMLDPAGRLVWYPLAGGAPRPIAGTQAGDEAVRFSSDGRALYLTRHEVPLRVFRARPRHRPARALERAPLGDPTGLQASFPAAVVSADGRSVVGTYTRRLNRLYVVTGVR